MKYCSKCGKEIMDEAVVCPNCGCATGDFYNRSRSSTYSSDYPIVKEFSAKAKKVKTLGIIALILCCGIGIIFSIAIWIMTGGININKTPIPKVNLSDPREIAEFEEAKRNILLGKKLAMVPYCIIAICLGILIFAAMMGGL